MASNQILTSSFSPIDETKPWNIKVQIIRMWKGTTKEPGNSVEMIVLDSSGTKIHATLDDEYVKKLLQLSDREGGERKYFFKWINDIVGEKNNKLNGGEIGIDILEDLLINECKDPIETIVKEVYGDFIAQSCSLDFHQERAILCATNADVDQINDYMLSQLPGEAKELFSINSTSPLDSIKVPGFPNHSLKLKVGAPVMLLKDLLPSEGSCKGTRLSITRLGTSVLEAKILTGNKAGKKVVMCRIPMETNVPIKMRRTQFPLTLAFAMTINQSQGQPLSKVGIFQPRQVFSHGPMYVAMSKVKSKDGAKIIITDKDGKSEEETRNAVFKAISQKI